jgi:hypothetical protein
MRGQPELETKSFFGSISASTQQTNHLPGKDLIAKGITLEFFTHLRQASLGSPFAYLPQALKILLGATGSSCQPLFVLHLRLQAASRVTTAASANGITKSSFISHTTSNTTFKAKLGVFPLPEVR